MKTVREILQNKDNNIYSIPPDARVFEALELMAQKNVGALLVTENGELTGIISERDYARKVILLGRTSRELLVREIMTHKVIFVSPKRNAEECMALMINKHIRHLPVMENGKLTGIISIGDVVKAVIEDREFVIDQLFQYITGTPALQDEAPAHSIEAPPVAGHSEH